MVGNEVVYLTKQICIPMFQGLYKGDPVLEVKINNQLVYLDKAKYSKAQSLGIKPKINGYTLEVLHLDENIA